MACRFNITRLCAKGGGGTALGLGTGSTLVSTGSPGTGNQLAVSTVMESINKAEKIIAKQMQSSVSLPDRLVGEKI